MYCDVFSAFRKLVFPDRWSGKANVLAADMAVLYQAIIVNFLFSSSTANLGRDNLEVL